MTERKKFDVVIIGAGPGGYVAAIKAAGLGKKVALIEKGEMGGTCLNVGCIPTKTLLAGAEVVNTVKHSEEYGISVSGFKVDFAKMYARKNKVVEGIRSSLTAMIQAKKITIFRGEGKFISKNEVKVIGSDSVILDAGKVIIATGSEPMEIPAFPTDHKRVFNSTSILEWKDLPTSLAVIGGGYIGCEFASLFAELGVKVTILEALDSIVALQGKTIAKELTTAFKARGIDIKTGVWVEGVDSGSDGVTIRIKGSESIKVDRALISIGRKVVSSELNLETLGIATDNRGAILVNSKMETNIEGVYAIGDVTGGMMLAHVASHQGIVAAMNACGHSEKMDYKAIPAVIFCHPEVAMVGMTEEAAKEAGFEVGIGKYPFKHHGKSIASAHTEGHAQVIFNKKTGQVLGAHVIGQEASALIGEMALAISRELLIEDISDTVHAHPTTAEAWMEAAMIAQGIAIHA